MNLSIWTFRLGNFAWRSGDNSHWHLGLIIDNEVWDLVFWKLYRYRETLTDD